MKKLKVTTAAGGVYIILDATAFGIDACIGRLQGQELRTFRFEDSDVVEEVA